MSELVVVPKAVARDVVTDARVVLRTADASDAKEFRDRAEAAETYARAKSLKTEYQAAGVAKLWAERRLGELGRATPVFCHFDDEIGISKTYGVHYRRLACIPEDMFATLLQDICDADGALNASAVLARAGRVYEVKVERGIYKVPDGRLVLQWRRDGTKHRELLPHEDLGKARETLAKRRGHLQEEVARPRTTPTYVANNIHFTLKNLYALDVSEASDEAKRLVQEAQGYLHKAKDALLAAENRWSL